MDPSSCAWRDIARHVRLGLQARRASQSRPQSRRRRRRRCGWWRRIPRLARCGAVAFKSSPATGRAGRASTALARPSHRGAVALRGLPRGLGGPRAVRLPADRRGFCVRALPHREKLPPQPPPGARAARPSSLQGRRLHPRLHRGPVALRTAWRLRRRRKGAAAGIPRLRGLRQHRERPAARRTVDDALCALVVRARAKHEGRSQRGPLQLLGVDVPLRRAHRGARARSEPSGIAVGAPGFYARAPRC
mmetsp:Transcript_1240/g.3727  ORF Transcript_1240/g.3727 Transcript_1240/m.3727 type:complete len:248 (+) Transcript_1240:482-1225(+)